MATYPACISDGQICTFCYASESCETCANEDSGPNPCETYCNSGCNTMCDAAQTFCYNGVLQTILHTDVAPYPDCCTVKDEIIHRNWTANFWNQIRNAMMITSELGIVKNQGSIPPSDAAVADPCMNAPHPDGSLITAEKYNQVADMINFFNEAVAHVNMNDVIMGAHSLALKTGYEAKTFNMDVCDVCNAGNENRNNCNCSCACSCTCTCPCDCSCSCSCPGCSCDCSSSGES